MSIPSQRRAGVYVRLVRLDNCVVAGVVTMAGGYLAVGPTGLDDRRVITAALVVIGAAAAANAVNDRVDAVGDAIGAPHRPIPSGAISLDEARRAALMLGGSSVALAFSIGPIFAVAAGALLGIGVIYSYRLKGVPVVGHSTVALLSASTVVYGAAAAGTVRSSVLIGSALVVCFIFVGEVLGAIEDREADAAVGLSTIAVRNPRAAQLLFEVSAAASILLAPAAWLVGEASDAFVVVMAVVVLPLVAGSVAALRFGSSPRGTVLAVRLMKAVWIGGLPGLLLLR